MGLRKALKRLVSHRPRSNAEAPKEPSETATQQLVVAKPEQTGRQLTPNEQVAVNFISIMNAGGDSAPLFTEKADVLVKDAPMFMEGYNSEAKKFSRSFPDFRIKVMDSGVKEQADGTVTIFVCASGTHSGEPYSFGPYPEIPATHIRVVNDPE